MATLMDAASRAGRSHRQSGLVRNGRCGTAARLVRFDKSCRHRMQHWHPSHAIVSGMPIEVAQQNLGHASLATTTAYIAAKKRRWMKAGEATRRSGSLPWRVDASRRLANPVVLPATKAATRLERA
jgi:integrase